MRAITQDHDPVPLTCRANYVHEVGDTLLWLELKFQNELILVHSRPFVTRTAQILKRINRLLRGNITRV